MSSALPFATIAEIAPRIESRDLSPVELTMTMLKQIAELDSHYHAYATVTPELALTQAREAEADIVRGNYRGPLHGVPIAVKDLFFTKGVRTMAGQSVLADHIPDFDATVVSRLRDAGAVLLGKLNLAEGAVAGYHRDFAIPLNPWNVERDSGTSSSGSGVATAAGLCFGSLGTDTGGSIRFPAAANGIVGLKPTWGRVSRHGVLALAESMDHVGPLTRCSRDAAYMLQAIAGPDRLDPTSLPDPVPDLSAEIESGVRGLRIGLDQDYVSRDVDPAVRDGVLRAVAVLEGLGAEIIEIELPDVLPYVAQFRALCSAEAVAAYAETYPSRAEEYGPYLRGWLKIGSAVSGAEYARAANLRADLVGLMRLALSDVDMLACPAMASRAQLVNVEALRENEPAEPDPMVLRFAAPFNLNGYPTITLLAGFSEDGLPIALQLVGHPLGEALLCRAGHTFEQATDWHARRPPAPP